MRFCGRSAGVFCFLLVWTGAFVAAGERDGIEAVAVGRESVAIRLGEGVSGDENLELIEEPGGFAIQDGEPSWRGKRTGEVIRLPRFDSQGRDRLYSAWQLRGGGAKLLGGKQWGEDLSGLSDRSDQFPKPASIKGVQCIVDVEDAIQLGVKQAAHNVLISQVIDLSGNPPQEVWEVDGRKIPIRADYIRHLDEFVSRLTKAGVGLSIILLNSVPSEPQAGNPLIHPQTNLKEAPNHLGGFNLTNEEGYLHYRAAVEYLANRYSQPDGVHGRVEGYIIGNELQAHWWWYNIGDAEPEEVIVDYARALRVAHLAVRKFHPALRVYISMDHHWRAAMSPDPKRFIPGKRLLEELNDAVRREGNFEWHVAFHPYPENLFNPRTWADREPTLKFDTPKITFKNLEVLPAFLKQEKYLFGGKMRRIILSEQGFHTPEGADGEQIQAAGYAYAYYRSNHIEGIDAFILHRHIDHRDEGGLKLGIRERKEGTVTDPGKKKLLYEVFREADTDRWERAFEFAKPILGIENWEELLPRPVSE